MKDTRSEIIRIADGLIRLKGYNAFSYADISKELNIKNAAIHYYFPSKSDLGEEVIKNAISMFEEQVVKWKDLDYREQYQKFVQMYTQTDADHLSSLVGALASSFHTLSENMQSELKRYIQMKNKWLTDLLTTGKEKGIFNFNEIPQIEAYLIQSVILASLLLNKVLDNDTSQMLRESILNI